MGVGIESTAGFNQDKFFPNEYEEDEKAKGRSVHLGKITVVDHET
jgi:hypothetical protein